MRRAFLIISLLLAFVLQSAAAAADSIASAPYRPVLSAYTMEVGSAHVRNTYLTPLRYSGWSATLNYERMQAMGFDPERWVMQLDFTARLDGVRNPARNATMWGLEAELSWAMLRRHRIASCPALQLYWGGFTALRGGALLLARNGNNPAQAIGAWTIGAEGAAVVNFNIRRLPVTLRYQARMPLTGIFFSPDYGELYYEIYMGNRSGLVHGAWPGNYFRLDNLATADLRLGNTVLRLGYACDVFSSKASGIVSRNVAHRFVLGVAVEWITIGRSRGIDPHARIISAMY
ncbi:MAG: DUF3316 domain-containing protein [Muribaculaceae bacterium]|nr:DUF3316 domain-containing protein [Muribaculaceae bacterium]